MRLSACLLLARPSHHFRPSAHSPEAVLRSSPPARASGPVPFRSIPDNDPNKTKQNKTNQPISQSANQPTNHRMNESINQSIPWNMFCKPNPNGG